MTHLSRTAPGCSTPVPGMAGQQRRYAPQRAGSRQQRTMSQQRVGSITSLRAPPASPGAQTRRRPLRPAAPRRHRCSRTTPHRCSARSLAQHRYMWALGVPAAHTQADESRFEALLSPIVIKSPRMRRDATDDDLPQVGTGTVASSVINICATAMGAGILSLPQAISRCGWVLGMVLIMIFAVLADVSLIFLVECGQQPCGS